jgi:hypothetical protein
MVPEAGIPVTEATGIVAIESLIPAVKVVLIPSEVPSAVVR